MTVSRTYRESSHFQILVVDQWVHLECKIYKCIIELKEDFSVQFFACYKKMDFIEKKVLYNKQ